MKQRQITSLLSSTSQTNKGSKVDLKTKDGENKMVRTFAQIYRRCSSLDCFDFPLIHTGEFLRNVSISATV